MKCVVLCLGLMLTSVVATLGQTSSSLVEVSGTVVDVNGEAVPKAKVTLRPKDGAKAQTTTSDAVGAFRFARVAAGNYEIEVQKEAFKPTIIQLTDSARAPVRLRVVLEIADLHEEVAVEARSSSVNTDPTENLD